MKAAIEWIDGWSGGEDWRSLTVGEVMQGLRELDHMEPTDHPDWEEIEAEVQREIAIRQRQEFWEKYGAEVRVLAASQMPGFQGDLEAWLLPDGFEAPADEAYAELFNALQARRYPAE